MADILWSEDLYENPLSEESLIHGANSFADVITAHMREKGMSHAAAIDHLAYCVGAAQAVAAAHVAVRHREMEEMRKTITHLRQKIDELEDEIGECSEFTDIADQQIQLLFKASETADDRLQSLESSESSEEA